MSERIIKNKKGKHKWRVAFSVNPADSCTPLLCGEKEMNENESSYYTDFAIKAFRIYLCMMVFACVNKACFIFLQAMCKALESTILSMVREIVFGVGFALLLPLKFGLDGGLYSMPLSEILTFLIAVFLICQTYKELSVDGSKSKEASV
ncbi:hypothetical protein SAMN02910276_01364 [Butyrivibrio sp. Su6]|uniref:hypothetical protein n=1 Tax=Butyrivibrio sp. Su6 TaxID=1520810 RepID=UPI00089F738F|nr:hypothetical protein [Butyrivibrio sp. Su6]SEF89414.1 hypothetical protein SAMN02910276_01364 [Butyrivibrio sp. Su6]